MSRDNEIYPRSIAEAVVEIFEDVLDANGIMVPDDTRRGDEGESCLYGNTYFSVLDQVETLVLESLKRVAEHPETVIVPYLYG